MRRPGRHGLPGSWRDDRGDSLLELIIAVAIIGVALAAIIGAIGAAFVMSQTHRTQAEAGAAARNYAEAIENMVAGGGYVGCASAAAYESAAPTTAMHAKILSVEYWTGTGWLSTCTADKGLQRLTVRVSDDSAGAGKVDQTVTLVLRRP